MIRSGYISCGLSQRRKLLISKEGTSWFGRRICFSFQHREYSLKVIKIKRKEKKKATNNLCHLLDAGRPPHLSRKWKLCDLSFASNVFSFTSHSFFFFFLFFFSIHGHASLVQLIFFWINYKLHPQSLRVFKFYTLKF